MPAGRPAVSEDIHEVLRRRFDKEIYSQDQLTEIANMTTQEYVVWLQSSQDDDVRFLVRSVFEEFTGGANPEGIIAKKMLEAVEIMSSTSDINRIRADMMKRALPSTK